MVMQIFLRQVVEEMKKIDVRGEAVPFDIEFKTFNRNNKSGGVLKKYQGAKLLIGKKIKGKVFIEADHFFRVGKVRKNPNHWQNRTRNIELSSGHIRKLNILYITKFNGLEVIY
jgi:hypothetical protein